MERVEKELEATVRQPANAEKYRMEQIAEAKRQKVILEAEAEAEAIRVSIVLQPIDILYTLDSASLLVKLKPRIFQRLPPFE
jgi:regulator of protease activity HflC (stomatin/prohibitin superfamily)